MHIPWDDVALFLAVLETRSLSAASRRLGVAQPTVSRRLAELESTVGEPLFARGVLGVTPTQLADRLAEPARRMAEWAAEVDAVLEQKEASPHGVVRITAAPGVAYDFVAPFAVHAKTRLPDVRLEVVATVQTVDLVRREADLALRMQQPTQRDVVVLASLAFDVRAFASASYAARLPKRAGLSDIDWIAWAPPLEHLSPNPQLAALIPGFAPVFASDDYVVQLRAAEAGMGAIFLGRVPNRFALPTTLVELPIDVGPLRGEMHLVAGRAGLAIPRVRAVAELLEEELVRVQRAIRRPARAAR